MIRLHTLGKLDLRGSDGQEIRSILTQPKRLALLAYLAMHGRLGFVGRDHLLALFWPDHDDERARGALNRAVYYLRHSLGEGILLSRGVDAIGLSPETFWCDAVELEGAATAGRHREVLDLYRGDLLDAFHVSDTAEFGNWLDAKRDRLKETACRSAWSLAEAEQRTGNHDLAAQWGRWAVERSPYDEASVQRLMALLDSGGDRAGAVHEYDRFAQQLSSDLELTPAPETRALLEAIRSRESAVRTVGRDVRGTSARGPEDQGAVESNASETAQASESPAVEAMKGREAALESPPENSHTVPPRRWVWPAIRQPVGRRILSVAATVVLAVTSWTLLAPRKAPIDSRLVGVSEIENRTGDAALDPLARMATERLARTVSDVVESAETMAPRRTLRVIRLEATVKRAAFFSRRERPGILVSGVLDRDEGVLRFHVRVIDSIRGGRPWVIPPIPTMSESPDDAALRELSQRATGAVVALGNPGLADWFPVATTPPTYEALAEYLRGSDAGAGEAGNHLERAAELDRTFLWARLEAASPGRMFDRARVHAILVDLEGQRGQLNELQMVVLSSLLAAEVGDRQAENQALYVAVQLAPRRFLREYATSAWQLHRPRQALDLLDRVDSLYPGARLSPTWDLRTTLLHELREHHEELALAQAARLVMPNELSIVARQMRALAALGEVREVFALIDSVSSLPSQLYYSPGAAMLEATRELRAHGHPDASSQMARRAIEWYRSNPAKASKFNPARHDDYFADGLYLAGDWKAAQALYEELLEKDPTRGVSYYGLLGAIAARNGDRAAAERYISALSNLDIPTEADLYEVGMERARIAVQLGEPERALAYLREGYDGGQGIDLHTDPDFESVLLSDPGFKEFVRPKG